MLLGYTECEVRSFWWWPGRSQPFPLPVDVGWYWTVVLLPLTPVPACLSPPSCEPWKGPWGCGWDHGVEVKAAPFPGRLQGSCFCDGQTRSRWK